MPEPGLITSKVRSYMESLSPTARAMLVRSLRASAGGDLPSELILAAVEGLEVAEDPAPTGPVGEPWSDRLERAFFAPLAPFLMDDETTSAAGRVSRRHLAPIWNWIRRDLAAAAWERALAADPLAADADAAPIARKLRREVVPALVDTLREVGTDPRARQKLSGHIGGESVFRALSDVAYVLQNDAAFANLLGQLPATVTVFDVADQSRVVDVLRIAVEQGPLTVEWIAASLLSRAANPAVLVHLACRLAGTTDPRLVAGSRVAPLVDAVIGRLEAIANNSTALCADPRCRDRFLVELRAYHDLSRAFELALPVESVSAWSRRVGAACAGLSATVSRQLEASAGLVRRALRFDAHDGWSGRFDTETFADAEFAVRVTLETRLVVDSLAVNEAAQRARKQVESTLELVTARLINELKSSSARDREQLAHAVDGAIRLCALVFGEDYAAMQRRSRDLGAQKPARASA